MPIDRLQLAQFGNLELLARQVVEGFITGMHKAHFMDFPLNLQSIDFIIMVNPRGILIGNYMVGRKGCTLKNMKRRPI